MPVYEYTAINPQGKKTKGTVDSDNIRAARQRLRAQGIFPTDIKEGAEVTKAQSRDVRRFFSANKISTKDLSIVTRQLATLVSAGLPLVGALQALSEQLDSPAQKRILVQVREDVEEGSALAKALGQFPKAFPRLYVNMVASGEASGTLDAVLTNLADYLEAQLELRRKVTSALFYPALMLVFCTLVVIGLVMFVVPTIVEIFQKQGAILPLPTRIMIVISNILVGYWWALLGLIALILYGIKSYYSQPRGRSNIDSLILRLPLIGGLYRKVATARIAATLSTLLQSGVGLLVALDIVKNIVNNVHISKALEEAREGVKEGKSLAKELAKSGHFPSMLSHMIGVGEQSGKMENMLERAGRAYESEVNATLAGLTSLIEPLMIMGLGGIVFAIVISILMPMVNLINIVQQ